MASAATTFSPTSGRATDAKEKKMSDLQHYTPGPARGARIQKSRGQNASDEDKWTLILVRELRHSPEKVWHALTDPAHLREWSPNAPPRS